MIFVLLGRMGKRVPEDVSLIGNGGKWRQGGMASQLTSIVVDEAELGRQSARVLHEMSTGSRPPNNSEEIMMPVDLHAGRTLVPF